LLIYYFFYYFFERRHAERVRWLERQMNAKGFWPIVGWSVFSFAPTDVIC